MKRCFVFACIAAAAMFAAACSPGVDDNEPVAPPEEEQPTLPDDDPDDPSEEPPVIDLDTCTLSVNTVKVKSGGDVITFTVSTNRSFEVTSDASWLTVMSDGRAVKDYSVSVKADSNEAWEPRSAELEVAFKVQSGDSVLIFTVNQDASVPGAPAGKKIYKPKGFESFDDEESQYSYYRMASSENLVLLWEDGFGRDLSKAPKLNGQNMTVDMDNLMKRTEEIYAYYRDVLKFIKKGSKADDYRMMMMLNYNLDGTVYGGGYDGVVGALWLSPNRIQDEKLNAVAHELGHSFQFQLGYDDPSAGFGSGGIFEMTSQWMLWQVNKDWMKDENYHWSDFMKQTHLAFMHNDNMYHSPFVLEYWSDKHGVEFIGDLWRAANGSSDPVAVYKKLTGISQEEFNDEMCEAAQKFMTYDFDRIRSNASSYANKHTCILDTLGGGVYRINAERTPQNYGYNGISLKIPDPGTTVTVEFNGLIDEISGTTNKNRAGWRYAFVGVPSSGSPIYGDICSEDVNGTVSFTTPSDAKLKYLWLVVTGAPSTHTAYNERVTFEYPYEIKITGTTPRCTLRKYSAK